MKSREAQKALKLIRETINGMATLKDNEVLTTDRAAMAAVSLKKAVNVLDLWLTDNLDHRTGVDDVLLVRFVAGDEDCRLILSDGVTVLRLCWPGEGETVELIYDPETPVPVFGRWKSIRSGLSEPTAFTGDHNVG